LTFPPEQNKDVQFDHTMEGSGLDSQRSVLIVDSSEETREVLQTALERRGLRTFSASEAGKGIKLAREHHPDVIVLDLEFDTSGPDGLAALEQQSAADRTCMVLLGSVRRPVPQPDSEFVAKPYHYGPLIRKIEEMVAKRF
jgi:two-component system cell cycle response regulator DivK